ncbi:hypothetical protein JYU19_00415 [bacterium AH-315-J21]|nr:hypothetical protein [bacterium AH-315-J21]
MKAIRPSETENSAKLTQTLSKSLLALVVILVVLRFVNLTYDSPLFYSGYSTSEISDPYMYTSFARNKILFDDWDPYNYARWDSWRLSIVSGVSYLAFLVGGVSRTTANLGALALQLGGFLFFVLALARHRPRLEVTLTAFLLLATCGLFFTGRIPLLENGVIFLSGLTLWLYLRHGESFWGVTLTGALVAFITLAAKLNGIVILAPLLIDTLLRKNISPSPSNTRTSDRYINAGALILGAVIFGILHSYLIYDRSPIELLTYFQNQIEAIGLTPALTGDYKEMVSSVLLYGSQNGLFRFQPVFMILSGGGLILVALRIAANRLKLANSSDRVLLLVGVWLVLGVLMLLPYTYRPSRYFMPLALPAAALAAYALSAALRGAFTKTFKIPSLTIKSVLALLFSSLVIIYLSVQTESVVSQFVIAGKSVIRPLSSTGVIIGIVGSLTVIVLVTRGLRLAKKISIALAICAILALTLRQASLLWAGLTAPMDTLHVQVADVGALLGPDALIAGTYGPAFTIDNNLHNLIHPFSAKLYEEDLFSRFPVTHIAVAPSEMKIAQSRYPILKNAQNIVQIWTRDGSFLIYRVPESKHTRTNYERGMDFLAVANLDSALVSFDKFLRNNPNSFRGRWAKARTLANLVRVEETVALLNEMTNVFDEYYFSHFLAGREYVTLYRFTRGSQYKHLALAEYSRAHELNPHVTPPKEDLP